MSDDLNSGQGSPPGGVPRPTRFVHPKGDRPTFHLMSPGGWVNDPNGPLFYRGEYHLFYQHLTSSTSWTWGLAWGHAVSKDLVHWRQLPLALEPTAGFADQDGCFSGCATVDEEGVPVILYTGVVRRPDREWKEGASLTCSQLAWEQQLMARCVDAESFWWRRHQPFWAGWMARKLARWRPPPHLASGTTATPLTVRCLANEVQLRARPAHPEDGELTTWEKVPAPWLHEPPPHLSVNAFRDPYLLERPSEDNGGWWRVMIGSAVEVVPGDCSTCVGTALVYRSRRLDEGWEYEGMLYEGKPQYGAIAECPVLASPPPLTAGADEPHAHALARQSSLPSPRPAADVAEEVYGQEAVLRRSPSAKRGVLRTTTMPTTFAKQLRQHLQFAETATPVNSPAQGAAGAGVGDGDGGAGAAARLSPGKIVSAAAAQAAATAAAEVATGELLPPGALVKTASWPPRAAGEQQQLSAALAAVAEEGEGPGEPATPSRRRGLPPPIKRPATPDRPPLDLSSPLMSPVRAGVLGRGLSRNTSAAAAIAALVAQEAGVPLSELVAQHNHAVAGRYTHFYSSSVGFCPPLYWLGSYVEGRFNMDGAWGPLPLDLGDIAYAPNLMMDAHGRLCMWLWLQEMPNPGGQHGYAGCMSVPRLLYLHGDHLHQQPAPELEQLRSGPSWRGKDLQLCLGQPMRVPTDVIPDTSHLDICLTVARGPGSGGDSDGGGAREGVVGMLLAPFTPDGHGAAVLYHVPTSNLVVVVGHDVGQAAIRGRVAPAVHEALEEAIAAGRGSRRVLTPAPLCNCKEREAAQPIGQHENSCVAVCGPEEAPEGSGGVADSTDATTNDESGNGSANLFATRALGGQLCLAHGEAAQELRLLLDYSLLELFAGSGEALATRVYRGQLDQVSLAQSLAGDEGVAAGQMWLLGDASAAVRSAEVHTIGSIWESFE